MPPIEDHPLRFQLANELHARPFPTLKPPCRAAFLAIKQPEDAAARDKNLDRAHLIALLDRHGAPHPQPGATHYFGQIGKHTLKWECHTEFVTYTIFGEGVAETPFDAGTFGMFPEDWLAEAPGARVTSALIRVEVAENDEGIEDKIGAWFVPESLAVSRVLDDSAIMAGDFRIDTAGHVRFAMFVRPDTDARRVGRIVQRLCEVEVYKAMSMLGFVRVQGLAGGMKEIDAKLTSLMEDMTGDVSRPEETLKALLGVSSELEKTLALSAFRFGATGAYSELVKQRIGVLREERFMGRQTFAEFMSRRFDPSMRTVTANENQLKTMADRATRAANLLRTRVDVERSAQNQQLLESMDRRADLQLRLQRTVEGLSVVAISYYAVNLVSYLAYPFAAGVGFGEKATIALVTPFVIVLVWLLVRRIRKSIHP